MYGRSWPGRLSRLPPAKQKQRRRVFCRFLHAKQDMLEKRVRLTVRLLLVIQQRPSRAGLWVVKVQPLGNERASESEGVSGPDARACGCTTFDAYRVHTVYTE